MSETPTKLTSSPNRKGRKQDHKQVESEKQHIIQNIPPNSQ